jgi:hypothetical protein
MDVSKYFGGTFLKVEDLKGRDPIRTRIVDVTMGSFDKLNLEFDDGAKMSVNATNGRALARAYGYESDDWINKEVELSVGRVEYQGNKVDSIVIKPLSEASKEKAPPKRTPDPFDDEIPF